MYLCVHCDILTFCQVDMFDAICLCSLSCLDVRVHIYVFTVACKCSLSHIYVRRLVYVFYIISLFFLCAYIYDIPFVSVQCYGFHLNVSLSDVVFVVNYMLKLIVTCRCSRDDKTALSTSTATGAPIKKDSVT